MEEDPVMIHYPWTRLSASVSLIADTALVNWRTFLKPQGTRSYPRQYTDLTLCPLWQIAKLFPHSRDKTSDAA